MADFLMSFESACHSARRYNHTTCVYKVGNGQWLYATTEHFLQNTRKDASNLYIEVTPQGVVNLKKKDLT